MRSTSTTSKPRRTSRRANSPVPHPRRAVAYGRAHRTPGASARAAPDRTSSESTDERPTEPAGEPRRPPALALDGPMLGARSIPMPCRRATRGVEPHRSLTPGLFALVGIIAFALPACNTPYTACAPGDPLCSAGLVPQDGAAQSNDAIQPVCDTITSVENCGACGIVCSTGMPNAHAICTDGTCGVECDSGFYSCEVACVELKDLETCGGAEADSGEPNPDAAGDDASLSEDAPEGGGDGEAGGSLGCEPDGALDDDASEPTCSGTTRIAWTVRARRASPAPSNAPAHE